MKRIPCRKCNKCGLYHNLAVKVCDGCGTALDNIPAILMDTRAFSKEQRGDFDESVTVYVQKCSACGTLNFTTDKKQPAKICYNCHKSRVAAVEPIVFTDEEENCSDAALNTDSENPSTTSYVRQQNNTTGTNKSTSPNSDEEDDDGWTVQDVFWLEELKDGIGKAASGNHNKNQREEIEKKMERWLPQSAVMLHDEKADDDDDVIDWPQNLGIAPLRKDSSVPNDQLVYPKMSEDITLTALCYGRLSFTVKAEGGRYMLGRSANQGSFLSQDGRVGNEHCYLFCKNGIWYVRDNNSQNGTAVNSKDIGLNGERALSNGDELKLGHHNDSVAFRIMID